MDRYSMNFGKKERVLNYTCQTYQLSRPNKVGAVMALIRDCQPSSFDEWQSWYFENAHTAGKNPTKITVESLHELGERLYAKITEVVIPEWEAAFRELTEQDCIDYIYNLTINRTYAGEGRESEGRFRERWFQRWFESWWLQGWFQGRFPGVAVQSQ